MSSLLTTAAIFLATALLTAPMAFAGNCELIIQRAACPGKDAEVFKPYDGKNPTVEKSSVASVDDCSKKAERASIVIRKGELAEKTVHAKFNGNDVGKVFTDKAPCK